MDKFLDLIVMGTSKIFCHFTEKYLPANETQVRNFIYPNDRLGKAN